ncbi:uncharacterized protein BDV14DRAFT_165865 [Aspergillus stella-maris]|uniref:uncharacterized protein n=1 Tax=Aspergillus stella-maris TaxID=1810926 RepID=UPI003CCCAE3D
MAFLEKFLPQKKEAKVERGSTSRQRQNGQEGASGGTDKTTSSDNQETDHPLCQTSENLETSRREKYERKIAQLEAQIEDMRSDHNQSTKTISPLTSELCQRQADLGQDFEELSRRDETIKALREELSTCHEERKQLNRVTRGRQGISLQSLIATKWHAPKEDRYVSDELFKLTDKIRQWARNNSASFSDLNAAGTSGTDSAVKYLGGYCAVHDWNTLINKFPVSKDKAPAHLVQAILAKDLFESLFADPFFAFIAIEGDETIPRPEQMRVLQNGIARVSDAESHIWRSQTIRSLSNSDNPEAQPYLAARIKPVCRHYVSDLLSSPIRFLLRSGENPVESYNNWVQELQSLYEGAAQLALMLWGQRASIAVRTLHELPLFRTENEELSAHRLHHLDEDDTRLDGKKALLLVQPAILAFGSESAEHYDQRKVWAPAVVLLDTQ